jgi:hypothetical protein
MGRMSTEWENADISIRITALWLIGSYSTIHPWPFFSNTRRIAIVLPLSSRRFLTGKTLNFPYCL